MVSTTKDNGNMNAGRRVEPGFVVDLTRVALAESEEQTTRIPVACTGTWVKGGQKFTISHSDLVQMASNFAKLGTDGRAKDDVLVDFEHASEFPEMAAGGPIPAAGWVKGVIPPASGSTFLYADVAFTDQVRKMIAGRQIKYVSPVIYWNWPDKRTGKDQGTTLVSLAVTNRPFLDELPAIALSDRGFHLVDLEQVHVLGQTTAQPEAPATGGKEKRMKKVNVSAIKGGDKAGHLKVSHPDMPEGSDFYADKDDVSDALSDANDVKAGKKLSEATGLEGKLLSEQLPVVKQRFAAKIITLSELPSKTEGPDKGAPDFASFAPAAGSLIAAEVFEAQAKETALTEAVEKRNILPKERAHLRKLTLSDLRAYLADRTTNAVDETEHGTGGAGGDAKGSAFSELKAEVERLVAAKRATGWSDAMRIVATEKPEMRKRYDDEQRKEAK